MKIQVNIKQTDNLILPTKAHDDDAGYDIYATSDPKIVGRGYSTPDGYGFAAVDYIEYETNICLEPQPKLIKNYNSGDLEQKNLLSTEVFFSTHTLIHPRSSISNTNLVLANSVGLVDANYRDSIKLRFKYIYQPEDLFSIPNNIDGIPSYIHFLTRVNRNKIYRKGNKIGQLLFEETNNAEFNVVKDLTDTTRSSGGFGSTGQ